VRDFNEPFTHCELFRPERAELIQRYVDRFGLPRLLTMAKSEPCILLTTTYKVKGGECDYVALFMDSTEKVNRTVVLARDDELRVLYTAVTRAKHGVFIVPSESNFSLLPLWVDILANYEGKAA
jgi:superfamily I DNA/RNA helicase